MAGILWFEIQNEGSISAWTFVRVHFVYVSQHFHGLWKQLYFLSSLHFKIETSLCSLWFFLPGFHSSLGRHLRNCQKQGTKSTKSWPGKQKAVKKNEKCWCDQSLWHFHAFTPLNECSKCFILGALDSGAWTAMASGISKHSWPLGYPWGPCQFSKYNGNKI